MNFIKSVFKMSNVLRFAGNNLDADYTIGEHSYRVACIAMAICDEYNKNIKLKKNKINTEEVLRKALLHDMEETETGDLPSPIKKIGNLKAELRFAGEKIMKNLLKDSPLEKFYLKLWVEDKDEESGEVIKIADKLEGLLASFYEFKRGNHYIKPSLISHMEWFKSEEGIQLITKYTYANRIYTYMIDSLLNHQENEEKFYNSLKKFQKK